MEPCPQALTRLLLSCPSPVHELEDAFILRNIASGHCKLEIVGTGPDSAAMAYEIQGRELVIIAARSLETKTSIDLTEAIISRATELAKANGCEFVRFHTFRPGLVAKTLKMGFLPAEFILRKKL